MTVFWILSALTLIMDRAAKLIAQNAMTLGERIVVIGGLLELRFTHNTGMALGILAGNVLAGIALPLIAITAGVFILRRYRLSRFVLAAAGLILGGFFGNFLVRVFIGYVLDMIYFPWLPFFICNVADVAITCGAALIGISLLFRPKDWLPRKTGGSANDQNPDG